ncbi:hypothetical protein MMC13_006202 [Lambiella insularis]|nr:hypothetical protein [Lambiella insularis]
MFAIIVVHFDAQAMPSPDYFAAAEVEFETQRQLEAAVVGQYEGADLKKSGALRVAKVAVEIAVPYCLVDLVENELKSYLRRDF